MKGLAQLASLGKDRKSMRQMPEGQADSQLIAASTPGDLSWVSATSPPTPSPSETTGFHYTQQTQVALGISFPFLKSIIYFPSFAFVTKIDF